MNLLSVNKFQHYTGHRVSESSVQYLWSQEQRWSPGGVGGQQRCHSQDPDPHVPPGGRRLMAGWARRQHSAHFCSTPAGLLMVKYAVSPRELTQLICIPDSRSERCGRRRRRRRKGTAPLIALGEIPAGQTNTPAALKPKLFLFPLD